MCHSGKLLLPHRREQDVVMKFESSVRNCGSAFVTQQGVCFESAFEPADSRCFDDVQADHGILENTKKAPCILWRCAANECS